MIYTKLHGRLGNHLFEMAAAATLAARNNDDFCACCHKDYLIASPDNCYIWELVQQYLPNIYRNIKILPEVPEGLEESRQQGFEYKPISYKPNLLLNGGFQSCKYFDEKIVREMFSIPEDIKQSILQKYKEAFSKPIIAVNVRRGDYCIIPHKLPVCSEKYFRKAMSFFPKESRFLFISDDIEWCKAHFKGDNFFFIEHSTPLEDLYAQTLCTDNIISNSTFSWWGAYLNPNPDKKVIAPSNWFGWSEETRHHNIQDLLPESWIMIHNQMEWRMYRLAVIRTIQEALLDIRDKIRPRK